MGRPPRKSDEPILPRSYWAAIAGYGALIAASVLGSYTAAIQYFDMDYETAVTVSFLTLAFARLLHTFNMRDAESSTLLNEVTRNPYVWQALALSVFLLLVAVFTGSLADILKLTDPGTTGWMLIVSGSLIPLVVGQAVKAVRGRWR
jgi:Ca2+-transporting ATPase